MSFVLYFYEIILNKAAGTIHFLRVIKFALHELKRHISIQRSLQDHFLTKFL